MSTCPGCVGRGTGTHCVVCDQPIPADKRRAANAPDEWRPDCAGCRRGQPHTH